MWFQRRCLFGQTRHPIALAALALLTFNTPRAVPGFQAPLNFDTGEQAYDVAVWDFNGDGIPDLAVANAGSYPSYTGGSVSVLLGKGDGTFHPAVQYAAGSGSIGITVGDLNGDGIADLAVVAISDNSVNVLFGNGDGTFQPARRYTAGIRPRTVAIADLNGDGIPDLAVACAGSAPNYSNGGFSVLLGNGDGTFRTAVTYESGARPSHVVVADFNHDGILDLAVTNYVNAGTVSVLLGNGDGTFQATIKYAAGSQPYGLAVADLNGDGILDLAVADVGSNSVSVLMGNGDGTFGPPQATPAGGYIVTAVAVADINGDGKLDLVVAVSGYSFIVSILLGNGDGSFQLAHSYGVGNDPNFVAVEDLNGDGKLDLVVANSFSYNVSVLLGNGDGSFKTAPSFGAGHSPATVAARDFNGDGIPDLAVANAGDNTVSVLLGNRDGIFQPAVQYPVGKLPVYLAAADLNGDGIPDLVVANAGTPPSFSDSSVSVLLGKGDGTFQAAVQYSTGNHSLSLAVGDFNGDGIPDLVVVNKGTSPSYADSSMSVLLGNGDGTFQAAVNYPAGKAPLSVAAGDFNGDGKLDLAVANEPITVSVLLGLGDGTFAAPVAYAVDPGPTSVVMGDFNNDGILDLAVAGSAGVSVIQGYVTIFLGNGDGTFKRASNYSVGPETKSLLVGDFNRDGISDLAVLFNGGVRVLLGNGDGRFKTAPISYLAGAYPVGLAIGDFNGDGLLDLAVANEISQDVSILLNDGKWTP
jgi:hypothetical protein